MSKLLHNHTHKFLVAIEIIIKQKHRKKRNLKKFGNLKVTCGGSSYEGPAKSFSRCLFLDCSRRISASILAWLGIFFPLFLPPISLPPPPPIPPGPPLSASIETQIFQTDLKEKKEKKEMKERESEKRVSERDVLFYLEK